MSQLYNPRYYDHLSRWTWDRGIDGFDRRNFPELNHEHEPLPSRSPSIAATMLASSRTPSYNPESPDSPNNSAARRYSSVENRPPIYGEFRSSDLYIATVLRSDTTSPAQPGRHSYTSQCTAVQQLHPRINWVLRVLGFRSIYRHGCGNVSEFLIEWTDSSPPQRAWDTETAWVEQNLIERIAPREVQEFLSETRLEYHQGLYGEMFTVAIRWKDRHQKPLENCKMWVKIIRIFHKHWSPTHHSTVLYLAMEPRTEFREVRWNADSPIDPLNRNESISPKSLPTSQFPLPSTSAWRAGRSLDLSNRGDGISPRNVPISQLPLPPSAPPAKPFQSPIRSIPRRKKGPLKAAENPVLNDHGKPWDALDPENPIVGDTASLHLWGSNNVRRIIDQNSRKFPWDPAQSLPLQPTSGYQYDFNSSPSGYENFVPNPIVPPSHVYAGAGYLPRFESTDLAPQFDCPTPTPSINVPDVAYNTLAFASWQYPVIQAPVQQHKTSYERNQGPPPVDTSGLRPLRPDGKKRSCREFEEQ
ncbi:unnamed protein product [Fusarium equiseti]|uniref:Uncharacterized protein n=1 Tax=Fusarium equiseti TaxID=61235 RepID=A0A8J2IX01_FUSEQ|nr:unnamed protein product [Fusarium equiseti]